MAIYAYGLLARRSSPIPFRVALFDRANGADRALFTNWGVLFSLLHWSILITSFYCMNTISKRRGLFSVYFPFTSK